MFNRVFNRHRDINIPVRAVYIGRGSKWGNPFIIGKDGSRYEVLEKYKHWIMQQQDLLDSLSELKGKDLVCFCKPLPCHGDILLELARRTIQSVDDLDCEDLREYCPWEGPPTTGGPDGPISCEGMHCVDAYADWLDAHSIKCDICGLTVDIDICEKFVQDDGNTICVCEHCMEEAEE